MADRSKLIRKCSVMTLKAGKEEEYRASHNEVRARHIFFGPPGALGLNLCRAPCAQRQIDGWRPADVAGGSGM
jgi:hypothetical protein